MRWLGLVVGAFVILAGAISFAAPDLRLSLEGSMMTPAGLYAILVFRVAIGLVFALVAPASRAPRTLRVLGLIVFGDALGSFLVYVFRMPARPRTW